VCEDLSIFGRYRALDYASHELIYVQDDNVIVEDPVLIVKTMSNLRMENSEGPMIDAVVCNSEAVPEFALGGAGAAFPRHLPGRTFEWFAAHQERGDFFLRNADIVFTGLTQRVLVEVPFERLSTNQRDLAERDQMIEIVSGLSQQDWSRA